MSDTTYNGWKNYETWAVKLWIDNEQSSQEVWEERAQLFLDEADGDNIEERRDYACGRLASDIKSEHEEAQPELEGIWADLLNAAMSEVDWFEIAENMLEELTPSDE